MLTLSGDCGISQPAAKTFLVICQAANICPKSNSTDADISHSLCNNFYNSAFTNNFVAKNTYCLVGTVNANTLPAGYKMGYDESRRWEASNALSFFNSKFPFFTVQASEESSQYRHPKTSHTTLSKEFASQVNNVFPEINYHLFFVYCWHKRFQN